MAYKIAPAFTVIKDTREQDGYYFKEYHPFAGMVQAKLDTGDYSIQGLEDKVCIERKGCVEELAMNLGQKKYAFLDEIERMTSFAHKFIVLEFSLEDLVKFPDETRIPIKNKASVKITGKYMLKCLLEFQLYNNVQILFCGDKYHAFLAVSSILKRVNEMYTIGRKK
jgi:glucosamine 6-phosphate synthetase-like amidotransferase/phosphosugar isomerase protein